LQSSTISLINDVKDHCNINYLHGMANIFNIFSAIPKITE
jgi:hypothetical protein